MCIPLLTVICPPPPYHSVSLRNPDKKLWPWEMAFVTDLLQWLHALQWINEPNTITFLELALDFEEFSERTLPQAPQVRRPQV